MAEKTDSSGSETSNGSRHTLSEIELLTEATPELLDRLTQDCRWGEWRDGDVVIDKNEASTDVYFVVEGSVRITEYVDDSREVAIAEVGAGECFGELSAIDLKVRSARVMATESTLLAALSAKQFRSLLLECPEISLVLLKRLAGYVRKVTARMSALSVQTPLQRVCVELLRLSEPDIGHEGRWTINNLPGHGEIASWTGTDREIVAETIGQLARNGIVERRHRTLRINDHAKLQRLAEQH